MLETLGQSPPGVPGPHLLRSALRTARLIDDDGTRRADARTSYGRFNSDGIYRFEDLVAGEELLLAAGLLREDQDILYRAVGLSERAEAGEEGGREPLLLPLLGPRPPLWLSGALTEDVVLEELIPSPDLEALGKSLDPEV